jgi:hypothetical protein
VKLIYPIFFLAIFLLGAYIGVNSFFRSKKIFSGREKGTSRIIADSALVGLSVTLLFFGGVNFFESISDPFYKFQLKELFTSLALFLVPGFIVFIGSIWQYFQVGIFREALLEHFKKRGNKENRK